MENINGCFIEGESTYDDLKSRIEYFVYYVLKIQEIKNNKDFNNSAFTIIKETGENFRDKFDYLDKIISYEIESYYNLLYYLRAINLIDEEVYSGVNKYLDYIFASKGLMGEIEDDTYKL